MKLKALLATLLAVPLIALAGVNTKNGNFHITYHDVILKKEAHELGITRTYNSKATELGWFGYGWGSKFETHLVVLPDGSAVIKENGSGRTNFYRTDNEIAIKSGVQKIVEAATKRENLTPAAAAELSAKLLGDEELRLNKVVKYGIHSELSKGAALGDDCGKASFTRVADSYRRIDCNRFGESESAVDTFDLQGRLTRHELEDGYAVTLSYPDAGTAVVSDTLGQNITLTWTPEGRVARVKTDKDDVKYLYDARQDLVEIANLSTGNDYGNNYRYAYDNNHNLTRITYIDDSSMFISYSPKGNGMVNSVTERSGDQQTFVYRTDPNNPNHYWTKHTVISSTGETASKEYEYENEVSTTGATQLTKIAQTGYGSSTETKFDNQGRVIRKVNDYGVVFEYTYHPQSDKLIQVMRDDLKTEFDWNGQGKLIRARNSNGQAIDLYYDSAQNIERMVEVNSADKTRRELTMEYNAAGQPTKIALLGKGKITVKYDDKGEIISVKSKQGSAMASQVSAAFESLLSVVRVADSRM